MVEAAAPSGFATFSADVMATTFRVTLPEGNDASALADSVFAVFRQVDTRMSEWKDTSPLSAVNREAGVRPTQVPADLREVIRRGIEIGALTGNLSELDGQPFVHAHAVASGHDLLARTGHVMRARVSATVELFVHDFGGAIHRAPDAATGLKLWQL